MYTPAFTLPVGTTARTRSPVRKPPTTLVAFAFWSGKPAASAADRRRTPATSAIRSDSPCGGKVPLVRVWERSLCPTHWLSHPINLLSAGLREPGTERPSQGLNFNALSKRLLAHSQGTGQHRGFNPLALAMGSLTRIRALGAHAALATATFYHTLARLRKGEQG
jgi:hypothetical protein